MILCWNMSFLTILLKNIMFWVKIYVLGNTSGFRKLRQKKFRKNAQNLSRFMRKRCTKVCQKKILENCAHFAQKIWSFCKKEKKIIFKEVVFYLSTPPPSLPPPWCLFMVKRSIASKFWKPGNILSLELFSMEQPSKLFNWCH